MITTVISDFGGVLTTPLGNAFAAWSQESGVPLEFLGEAMEKATHAHDGQHPLFLLERGELTEREFLDRLQAAVPGGHDLEGMFDVWFGFLERNHEMIELMRDLKARGLRMALLTNNVREWEPRWRPMLPELDEIFEVVVDSGFVGMRKPEPGIYELTLERLGGVPASECLFVDDMELNCEAARELGMTAVQFHDTEQARREVEAVLA
ncbi:MAG TPA: HAD family phosphatase [Thermoleophilaceae bacterium]|nr:HAD family phosphatase [Thermoleophilaceae bacterium]